MQPASFQLNNSDRLTDWLYEVWVVCPRCEATAIHRQKDEDIFQRRLVCTACNFAKDWNGNGLDYRRGDAMDPISQLELVLTAQTAKGTIYAYNPSHLLQLRAFIFADHRKRSNKPGNDGGWSNQNYYARLPAWMKSGNNREMLVKKIDYLIAKHGITPS